MNLKFSPNDPKQREKCIPQLLTNWQFKQVSDIILIHRINFNKKVIKCRAVCYVIKYSIPLNPMHEKLKLTTFRSSTYNPIR
jgi:hypothetical protein